MTLNRFLAGEPVKYLTSAADGNSILAKHVWLTAKFGPNVECIIIRAADGKVIREIGCEAKYAAEFYGRIGDRIVEDE